MPDAWDDLVYATGQGTPRVPRAVFGDVFGSGGVSFARRAPAHARWDTGASPLVVDDLSHLEAPRPVTVLGGLSLPQFDTTGSHTFWTGRRGDFFIGTGYFGVVHHEHRDRPGDWLKTALAEAAPPELKPIASDPLLVIYAGTLAGDTLPDSVDVSVNPAVTPPPAARHLVQRAGGCLSLGTVAG